ncbi:MAG: hypothetical protein C5B57_08310 [Blastocatellia bacterium]|nr:MAG: hypothetical protein C5B57_08310 [Blastocatellia bacterium]
MMVRKPFLLSFVGVLALTFQAVLSTQKLASVAGKWDVTIRMPDRSNSEQWTIQQKGSAITATAKGDRGELPVAGMIEGAFFRVTVKDGDKQYKVRATVDGNEMDGSITYGTGQEFLWQAKRSKAK